MYEGCLPLFNPHDISFQGALSILQTCKYDVAHAYVCTSSWAQSNPCNKLKVLAMKVVPRLRPSLQRVRMHCLQYGFAPGYKASIVKFLSQKVKFKIKSDSMTNILKPGTTGNNFLITHGLICQHQ